MSTIAIKTDAIRRLLGDIEDINATYLREHSIALRAANDGRLGEEGDCGKLEEQFTIACQYIARARNGDSDSISVARARALVEREYRLRHGVVEELAP